MSFLPARASYQATSAPPASSGTTVGEPRAPDPVAITIPVSGQPTANDPSPITCWSTMSIPGGGPDEGCSQAMKAPAPPSEPIAGCAWASAEEVILAPPALHPADAP